MHFYQFHIGDYKSHTHHLSPMEDLAYRRLLDHYYLHEAPIKQRDIARQIGMREFEQDVLTVLDEFFVSTEAGFINPRADAEIAKFKEFAEAGKRGAAKRWAKATPEASLEATLKAGHKGSNGEANSPPNPTPIATNNHKPITNNQEPSLSVAPSALDGRFERFWKAYPKKTGKDAALTAFKKRKPDDKLLNEMIFALGQQKKSPEWLKDGGQFIPNPSTWLNQGRWKDEGLELDKPANPFAGDI